MDYLQLIPVKIGNKASSREKEISLVLSKLKKLVTELDVPIIVLSNLSDSLENRGGSKQPIITDLPDFKIIRFFADVISFLYRPEEFFNCRYFSMIEIAQIIIYSNYGK